MWRSSQLLLCITYIIQLVLSYPFTARSRFIFDQSTGRRVKLACVNWPSHMETLLPEGLVRRTVDELVAEIIGMNFTCVRFTVSNDLIFNMRETVYRFAKWPFISDKSRQTMLDKNSELFRQNTTVYDVFAAAMHALNERKVSVVLDNHVSKATWCCGLFDGNRWWNRQYFPVNGWIHALEEMSRLARQWKNIIGIGLRNEVHSFKLGQADEWFRYMRMGALAVHKTNPDLLIIVGGLDSASRLNQLRAQPFVLSDQHPATLKSKIVFEAHYYNLIYIRPLWPLLGFKRTCQYMHKFLNDRVGFLYNRYPVDSLEMNDTADSQQMAPVWFSEFGLAIVPLADNFTTSDVQYLDCFTSYLDRYDLDWAYWQLSGHYYYRQGVLDFPEQWGLLDPVSECNDQLIASASGCPGSGGKHGWVMKRLQKIITKRIDPQLSPHLKMIQQL